MHHPRRLDRGGGGNTTKLHIPGLKKQAGVEIVAVANRTRESGQRVASEFGIAKVHDDWRALLDDDGIDAVCIGTWPYMHSTMLVAALEAGKHVLCEARMAMDHDDARDMLDAARRHPSLTAQIVPAPHTLAFDWLSGLLPLAIINIVPQPASTRSKLN